jgi:UDP-GlcNAc:undecaprenyl-phosphate GlcNAc-1-phosphate transferase
MTFVELLITVLTAFFANLIVTPIIIRVSHRNSWYDERNHRKIHVADTPRIGGIGIFVAFLLSVLVLFLLASRLPGTPRLVAGWTARFGSLVLRFLPLLGGVAIIHFLGLIDDFRNLRAVIKLLVQIAAAIVVVLGPFRIETLIIPFSEAEIHLGFWSYPITVIWIVAISNALNFIDGVDGLAGGTAAIAALVFGIVAYLLGHGLAAAMAVGLLGALVGFLVFNLPPARVFMGDSGSYVLGFLLGTLPLTMADGGRSSLALIPVITILFVPIVDMTTSVFRRLRRGKHPFSADREHLHHKLMDLGMGSWKILSVIYLSNIILGLGALSWYLVAPEIAVPVNLALWIAAALVASALTRAQRRNSEAM